MCTKGVWQLKELTVRFCASGKASAGARDFLRTHLTEFAEANPQLTIKAECKPNRPAILVGEYLGGTSRQAEVSNRSAEEVLEAALTMRNQTGHKVVRVRENVKSSHPSIQGFWDPTTDLDSGFVLRV